MEKKLDLQAIKERLAEVTPGPWKFEPEDNDKYPAIVDNQEDCVCFFEGGAPKIADAVFMAHARQDVPALIAEVERLTKALEEIRVADEITFSLDQETDLICGIADRTLKGESYDDLIEEMKRVNESEESTDESRD